MQAVIPNNSALQNKVGTSFFCGISSFASKRMGAAWPNVKSSFLRDEKENSL